jgi:hypothetical protein
MLYVCVIMTTPISAVQATISCGRGTPRSVSRGLTQSYRGTYACCVNVYVYVYVCVCAGV